MLGIVGICLIVVVVLLYRFVFGRGGEIPAANKGVLITGAASGIGLALVKELLFNRKYSGVHVYATDANEQAIQANLAPLKDELDHGRNASKITLMKLDVTNAEEVRHARERIQENGDFFAVINNAGVANGYPRFKNEDGELGPMVFQGIDELHLPDVYHIWDINVFGVLRVTHEFMKILPPNGAIVSIASIAGLFSGPYFSYYAMTKHAVVSFMDSLRRECYKTNFRFVTICPGFVKTPLLSVLHQMRFDPQYSRHAADAEAKILKNRSQLHEGSQSAEEVAHVIIDSGVFRAHPNPILVIDRPPLRFLYRFLSMAPARISDWLISFL